MRIGSHCSLACVLSELAAVQCAECTYILRSFSLDPLALLVLFLVLSTRTGYS